MTINNLTLCAVPYDITGRAFYFEDLEEYETKAAAHRCEEFEIQFIDGSVFELGLFHAADITQCTLSEYFEILDRELNDYEQAAILILLADLSYNLDGALSNYENLPVYESDAWTDDEAIAEYAQEFAESVGDMASVPAFLAYHIDWSGVGRDMDLGVFKYQGSRFVYESNAV